MRANYLASPPLVVAYALAGSMYSDLLKQPLGLDQRGKKVFLKDIWPSSREIHGMVRKTINKQMFIKKYADVFKGDSHWRGIRVKGGLTYGWDKKSTYVQNPPYFVGMGRHPARSPTSSTPACSACCSTRSPPTTSRRRARSRSSRRPANI